MVDCLNEQIENIRSDDFDFLNSKLVKEPNDEVIKKLKQIYEEQYNKRKLDLKNEKKKPPKISAKTSCYSGWYARFWFRAVLVEISDNIDVANCHFCKIEAFN